MNENKALKKRVYHLGNPHAIGGMGSVLSYLDAYWNGVYYEPPLSLAGLVNARSVMPWHESAMDVKRQILATTVQINKPDIITMDDVENIIEDFLWSGNCYAQLEHSITGKLLRVRHAPALYMRRKRHPQDYVWLKNGIVDKEFTRGAIAHLKRYDPKQEVYGMPAYLSAMNHAFLNKSSVVIRRKYTDNGGQMGYILYLRSKDIEDEAVADIEDAIYDTSGDVGNLLVHDPSGEDADLKLLKLSEISKEDNFFDTQNATRDGVMAIHRVPVEVMGVIPSNVGGFGDPVKAVTVFARNEITYLQTKLAMINVITGIELLTFHKYKIDDVQDTNK